MSASAWLTAPRAAWPAGNRQFLTVARQFELDGVGTSLELAEPRRQAIIDKLLARRAVKRIEARCQHEELRDAFGQ